MIVEILNMRSTGKVNLSTHRVSQGFTCIANYHYVCTRNDKLICMLTRVRPILCQNFPSDLLPSTEYCKNDKVIKSLVNQPNVDLTGVISGRANLESIDMGTHSSWKNTM